MATLGLRGFPDILLVSGVVEAFPERDYRNKIAEAGTLTAGAQSSGRGATVGPKWLCGEGQIIRLENTPEPDHSTSTSGCG